MEKKLTNNALLSIDVRIRFRGELYKLELARIIKWLGALTVIGFRIYRVIQGDSS